MNKGKDKQEKACFLSHNIQDPRYSSLTKKKKGLHTHNTEKTKTRYPLSRIIIALNVNRWKGLDFSTSHDKLGWVVIYCIAIDCRYLFIKPEY